MLNISEMGERIILNCTLIWSIECLHYNGTRFESGSFFSLLLVKSSGRCCREITNIDPPQPTSLLKSLYKFIWFVVRSVSILCKNIWDLWSVYYSFIGSIFFRNIWDLWSVSVPYTDSCIKVPQDSEKNAFSLMHSF